MKNYLTSKRYNRVDAIAIAAAANLVGGGDWAMAGLALVIGFAINELFARVQ